MRIFSFLHALDPGGVEQVALRLCRFWCADGHDVHLFLGRHTGPLPTDLDGVNVVVGYGGQLPIRKVEDLWMACALPRVIETVRPDVVFCAGNTYAFAAVVARVRLGERCPPIVSKISNDLRRLDMTFALRGLYHGWCRLQGRIFTSLVAIAPAMRSEIEECATPRSHVAVIPDAVLETAPDAIRTGSTRTRGRVKKGRRFLAVGRLEPQKNLSLMLDAFALGACENDQLTIIGGGRLKSELAEQAKSLGIGERVLFLGHQTDVDTLWGQADALLLTSLYEGMPAVVVEALATGVPVIASSCCASLKEMLATSECGRLVTEQGAEAFAQALRDFDPNLCSLQAMRAAALPFIVADSATAYIELFKALCERRAAFPSAGSYYRCPPVPCATNKAFS